MVEFELQVHCVIHWFQNSAFFPSPHLYHSGTILLLSPVSVPSVEELEYLKSLEHLKSLYSVKHLS